MPFDCDNAACLCAALRWWEEDPGQGTAFRKAWKICLNVNCSRIVCLSWRLRLYSAVIYTGWRQLHSLAVCWAGSWFKWENWSLCISPQFSPLWALLYLICLSQKKYLQGNVCFQWLRGRIWRDTWSTMPMREQVRENVTVPDSGICEPKTPYCFFSVEIITFVPKPVLFVETVGDFCTAKGIGISSSNKGSESGSRRWF